MIATDIKERENIIVATPDGGITADDITAFAEKIDTYINSHDMVPNLVFHVHKLPHWKDFHALSEHLKLVKDHHRIVKKVAVVTDSRLISLARVLVDRFTGAKVRRFPELALDDAINWAQMEEDHTGEFMVVEGLPDDVVALDARGMITSVDYEKSLIPLVEEKLKRHDKLKVLLVAGTYFDGFSEGAMWDDARFGMSHLTTFSKMALVTDVDWLRRSAKLFGMLLPTELMVFDLADLEDAKEWIKA